MKCSAVVAAASLLAAASAHGGVGTYTVGTTSYPGWSPYTTAAGQVSIQRQYPSFNPLLLADLTTVNIRCNNPGTRGTGVMGTIAAGQTLVATWTQWTHRPSVADVYLAKCPSTGCDSWDGAGTVWFKIDAVGLIKGTENNGTWAGDQIVDTLKWSTVIPASLAPGDYLMRTELIALHQANNPQFYPECSQWTITGSGTKNPDSSFLVSFPGAYSATDPGIDFNIDSQAAMIATSYPIPGPAPWDGTGSIAPVASAKPATPTTLATSKAPAATAPACTAVKYAQCGGIGFSGCSTCAAGSTCTANGDYYSQCM